MLKIEKIFEDGVLVDLDVGCWSGQATLQAADLKLKQHEIPAIFKLGKKWLIEPDVLQPIRVIEREGRMTLKAWAFDFPIGGARFVPKASLGRVIDRLDDLKAQFDLAVETFLSEYAGRTVEMLERYPDHRDALEAYYPHLDSLKKKFSFRYTVYAVELPEGNNAIRPEHRNALAERLATFADDVALELRKQTANLFTKIAGRLKRDEVVSTATLKKMRDFMDRFELLNFMSDEEVTLRMKRLRAVINGMGDEEAVTPDLAAAIDQVARVADDLTDVDTVTGEYKRRILVEA